MYKSITIANWFLKLAHDHKIEVNAMKLTKLVYIAHGYYLALKNEPLIDESICARDYGITIRSIYDAFSKYGSGVVPLPKEVYPIGSELDGYLRKIFDVFKHFTPIQIASWTIVQDSPFWQLENGVLGRRLRTGEMLFIDDESIKSYFENQLINEGQDIA